MNRLIILAALLLSVVGGLTLMSSSSPLAAQTQPSADRSFDPASVKPGENVTVEIDIEGASLAGTITEAVPAGFTYVSNTGIPLNLGTSVFPSAQAAGSLVFPFVANSDGEGKVSYVLTAPSPTEATTYTFGGVLNPGNITVSGTSTLDVTVTPPQTGPAVEPNNLEFDVVPTQAVKGARVSGVGNPIATDPLEWVVADPDTGFTLDFPDDGVVSGDFRVKSTGSGKFGLFVENSGADSLGESHEINVDLTYSNDDGEERTSTLMGTVTARAALEVEEDAGGGITFTIPQNVAPETPIYYFNVDGDVDEKNESLDGIVTGKDGNDDASPFGVNDEDMTIYRKNGANLEVRNYEFLLTVNGDAGLAARADRVAVTVTVTASNTKHTHNTGTFAATIYENVEDAGLVSAGTPVGDASEGITNPDGDKLTYSLGPGGALFAIDDKSGEITVGEAGIGDSDDGMNVDYEFDIIVSDGVIANNVVIEATVTVDVNDPVTAKTNDLPEGVVHHSGTATYTVTTPEVAGTVNGYHILNVSDLVVLDLDEDGMTETPEYTPSVRTAPLNVDDDGRLLLTHVPREFQDGVDDEALPSIDVRIDDGYNPSFTIEINVVLNVRERPDQITPSLAADIDENETGEVQAALTTLDPTGNATLGALITEINKTVAEGDGVEYKHTGGTNGGEPGADPTFSVNRETGAIILNRKQDADELTAMPSVVLQVERDSDGADIGVVFVAITINNVNEAPVFASDTAYGWVSENAVLNSAVKMSSDRDAADFMPMATDDDGDSLTYTEDSDLFGIMNGKLVVTGMLDADSGVTRHTVVITASDGRDGTDMQTVTVMVGDANDDPEFVDPASTDTIVPIERATAEIDETMGNRSDVNDHGTEAGRLVESFKVIDNDGMSNTLVFELDEGVSDNLFEIKNVERSSADDTVWTGQIWTKAGPALDYEGTGAYPYNVNTGYTVLVEVNDGQQGDDTLTIHVTLNNLNDNAPMINASAPRNVTVYENTARDTALADYSATDADGDTVTYAVDSDSFSISDSGMLMTLESLDADNERMPCGPNGCDLKVIASDGGNGGTTKDVTVTVNNADDSVSGFSISKANPIANISSEGDDAMTALADAKAGGYEYLWNMLDCPAMNDLVGAHDQPDTAESPYCRMYDGLSASAKAKVDAAFAAMDMSAPAESPYALPATMGSAPRNFVSADWGNWGTVLRIEVTSESPDPDCGNGNQCVFLGLDADSSDENLRLEAYRSSTKENLFIAAVKLVRREDGGTAGASVPVYKHSDGSVARLIVDEEDDVEIRLIEKDAAGEFTDSKVAPIRVEVENERPEFSNFMPEHEAAFDDGDVEYTFVITDAVSGIPEPEDLPDANGDSDYMPLVALVSNVQCDLVQYDSDGNREVPMDDNNKPRYSEKSDVHSYAGNEVWCKGAPAIWPITDDRDFDEIDDGFEVDTKIVLDVNRHHYVTFIVCDVAGNCALYTPDNNEVEEAFAKITVDTGDPLLHEARTGIMWDTTDEKLDKNNPTWIQVIFRDLSVIDEDSVEADDFVVKGHTVKDAKRYSDDADGDNARLDDDPSDPGNVNTWRSIFLELEDELAPDEEPNVSVVPNGIMDKAGNEQDDGDVDAKDYIAPSFTVVSIVSPRTPDAGMDDQLAGEDDEVVITLMSDERIQETRPKVTVTHVDAPAKSVFTNTVRGKCDDNPATRDKTEEYRVRGEIVHNKTCQDADAAQGSTLGQTISKVSNTEWTIIVKEPDSTGYYNIYIEGTDRSEQKNKGDEGIAPADIVTDFFERDGDVNTDDAHFFQGDRNLANPAVWVSGERIEDTEPGVEFKTPLFVELNFTETYLRDCEGETPGSDDYKAKCFAESDEYAKDSFDSVTVTSFTLNGVDITDSVKTTDDETFLVSLESIGLGDHEIEIEAMDEAGNTLDKTLSIEFEVEEREAFSKRLNPGWNLVSIPGEPADSDISVVFGSDMEVRTIYTYNPIIPGGWMVAVRESKDSEWQGDLTEITARHGYWVLSDAIQDWEVSIPRLAGGAVGSGTPIQPPVIALYAGWNLVPVVDVTGDFAGGGISAQTYLQSLDDGLDLARVLGFDTITNKWSTVMAPEGGDHSDTLDYGKAYWVFVRQAASLVPGN